VKPATSDLRADLALVGITFIWGSTFVVVKQALDDISPILFLSLRFLVATIVLSAVFLASRQMREARGGFRAGAIAGTFLFAGYAFQTVGLQFTTAPKSAFLTALSIAMVPLLSAAVYKNRPQAVELAGVLLATVGMACMTLEGAQLRISRGDFLTLLCAVAFAGHIVVVGHYTRIVSFQALSLGQVGMAAVLAAAMVGWAEPIVLRWSSRVVVAIAVTGVLATALAFSVQAWAQKKISATRAALIFSLEPVFAWGSTYLKEAETVRAETVAGAVLILAGILLVELKPFHSSTHPSQQV